MRAAPEKRERKKRDHLPRPRSQPIYWHISESLMNVAVGTQAPRGAGRHQPVVRRLADYLAVPSGAGLPKRGTQLSGRHPKEIGVEVF